MDIHFLVSEYKKLTRELGRVPTRTEYIAQTQASDWALRTHKFTEVQLMAGDLSDIVFEAPEIRPPKILYFDCELSHMTVKTYQLRVDYIPPKNIVKHWHFLSWAGLFEDELDKDYYLDQRYAANMEDDRQLIEGLHDILSKADILIGHNIKKFDLKKFNTKAAKFGLPSLSPKIVYDTLRLFKKHFDLPAYSLGFICEYFNLTQQKQHHSSDMWDRCLTGDLSAWEENESYNKQDNHAARAAFWFIAKYEPTINIQAFHYAPVCICGSTEFLKDGFQFTKQGKFQVKRCKACKKPFTGKENLIDKDLRKGFFK